MQTSGVADLAGRVLAGRYRLVAPIGTGASGRVYAAWDVRLRRRVAVKVLHLALAEDSGFLRRFGTEAQLAASLHHPHVVAVHDWGEDGTPFMVMELLVGGSLRSVLDRGDRLSPAQAAAVGRQVMAALGYAHARGVVHRDMKPANLLFDEHGGIRVADFGLARALAEASWTEPAGAVLGTARYAAPEQVRGTVDARSDLYSVALVLVEAVTGEVPFAAETSLGGLLSRLDAPLEVPDALGPLVPVLERAGRTDPADRYADAAAFGAAIGRAAADMAAPLPLPLVVNLAEPAADPDPTTIAVPAAPVPVDPGPALPGPVAAEVAAAPAPVAVPPSRRRRRRRSVPAIGMLMALSVLVAAAGGALAVGRAGGPQVRVPNVVGATRPEATATAGRAGLRTQTAEVAALDPAGTVIRQEPDPGALLSRGRRLTLVVSSGPAPVPVPAVSQMPASDATAALEEAGFVVSVERAFHAEVAAGLVVSQDPLPEPGAPPGGEVRLVVSDGPEPVVVPNVVGDTVDEATGKLAQRRLGITEEAAFSDSVPAGKVISQDPVPGEDAPRDSVVTVTVSRGPDLVRVPDVKGDDVEDAVEALEEAGLDVDVFNYRPGRSVKAQDPEPRERVRRGSTVTLIL